MIAVISWVATGLSLLGQILVNKKIKYAFPIWITANLLWILVNFLGTPNPAQIVMYAVYSLANIHGWVNWTRDKNN